MVELTAYKCEHCGKLHRRRCACAKHELRCWKNPERVPLVGELTRAWLTGRVVNYGMSDDLPDGFMWMEWTRRSEPPPSWWPGETWDDGLGKIFDGVAWHSVPGWTLGPEIGAHGLAVAPPEDKWPELQERDLDRWGRFERLGLLGLEQKTLAADATDAQE